MNTAMSIYFRPERLERLRIEVAETAARRARKREQKRILDSCLARAKTLILEEGVTISEAARSVGLSAATTWGHLRFDPDVDGMYRSKEAARAKRRRNAVPSAA